jgi:hypothetical protein
VIVQGRFRATRLMELMCNEELSSCFIPYLLRQPLLRPPEFDINGVLASHGEAAEPGGLLLPGENDEQNRKVAALYGAVAG